VLTPHSTVKSITDTRSYRHTRSNQRDERRAQESSTSNATRTQPHTAIAETSHSYITHLTEFGYPARFVQEQAGHAYGSTTAIYMGASNEYRNKLLEAALKGRLGEDWE
jgi:site-specific recombinase XerD